MKPAVKVQHLRQTSKCPHEITKESSWIKEWEKITGKQRPTKCPMYKKRGDAGRLTICAKDLTVKNVIKGAHVTIVKKDGIKTEVKDLKVYIVPSCDECNEDWGDKGRQDKGRGFEGHSMYIDDISMCMLLPGCTCIINHPKNIVQSATAYTRGRDVQYNASVSSINMATPSISSSISSIVNYGLKELFDEMETIMKNATKYPNYWKTEESDHKKALAKYSMQKANKCLDITSLTHHIRDTLDPIEISKAKINELIKKSREMT